MSLVAEDFELLDAWRAGDRAAGDELFERHFDSICRFFRTKLGPNLPEVEDLIQRTFLDCSKSRDRIDGATFRAYLFAIARNRLYDYLRTTHRCPITELESRSIADLRTSPSQLVARREEHALVVEAMRHLPLDFQITLELKYWEQLSDAEVATALQISPNTVRSRLTRGRGMLKEVLDRLRGDV